MAIADMAGAGLAVLGLVLIIIVVLWRGVSEALHHP